MQNASNRIVAHCLLLLYTFLAVASIGNAEKYDGKLGLGSLSRIAPVLGESAIVDKATGRVFWQGGKQSLFESVVGHSYLSHQQEGVLRHVRATLFSCILWMSFIRFFAEWALKQKILTRLTETFTLTSQKVLDTIKLLTRAALFCLVCLPKFSKEFIVVVVIMYLLESYICNTRKYLDNTLTCPDEVENFMEGLREEGPRVSWNIRCYHYEKRKLLCLLLLVDVWKYLIKKIALIGNNTNTSESVFIEDVKSLGPSFFTKKVVTHQMKQVYQMRSFEDKSIGGIWKQAQAATTVMAAFTRISLHKLLVFADDPTRIDYFQQQSQFISKEGKRDMYAEFSTKVDVEGYKEKVLAVRPRKGLQKMFDIRYYWFFTLIGFTVPYRIKFGRHCDELRVTIVKETSLAHNSDKTSPTEQKSSWLSTPRSWFKGNDVVKDDRGEKFKKHMQQMSLYNGFRVPEISTSQEEESNEDGDHRDDAPAEELRSDGISIDEEKCNNVDSTEEKISHAADSSHDEGETNKGNRDVVLIDKSSAHKFDNTSPTEQKNSWLSTPRLWLKGSDVVQEGRGEKQIDPNNGDRVSEISASQEEDSNVDGTHDDKSEDDIRVNEEKTNNEGETNTDNRDNINLTQ